MEPFTFVKSKAVPFDRVNVDTDQIVPKQFLKSTSKTGYGKYLFYDWRFDAQGKPRQDFVLNEQKYAGRKILLARDNFGSGSSREHASFADIFYNNCWKNGILAVNLRSDEVDYLFDNKDLDILVDLSSQNVTAGKLHTRFEIDEFRKTVLLEGLDSIGLTLKLKEHIDHFEAKKTTMIPAKG
jgi:3-isopropylmalate/(R)-2-methylmalate dehydratase small subunit